MINTQDKNFLALISRSPDEGDGWRSVSDVCWKLVEQFKSPELIEIDKENRRVRPTAEGDVVIRYLI